MPSERINQIRWRRFKFRQQSGWRKGPLMQAQEKADSAEGERRTVDTERNTAHSVAMKLGWASLTEVEKKLTFKEPPDSLTFDLGACAVHEKTFFEKWPHRRTKRFVGVIRSLNQCPSNPYPPCSSIGR